MTSYLVSNSIILPMSGWLARPLRAPPHPAYLGHGVYLDLIPLRHGEQPAMADFLPCAAGSHRRRTATPAQAVLLETSPLQQHGTAMAAFGLGIILAPILGPRLGRWITDDYSWRRIFYLNLPVGVISVLIISAFVRDPYYIGKHKTGGVESMRHRISRPRVWHVAGGSRHRSTQRPASISVRVIGTSSGRR